LERSIRPARRLLSAQANVDKAQLDLGFHQDLFPLDGIAGLAKAQIGNLVGPGGMEELTTVSTVNPIKVYIQVSEQEYLHSARNVDRRRDDKQLAGLILADGSTYSHRGAFGFADRQVDVKTGTMRVAAIFPNPNNFLRPGQYGRVRVAISILKDALLVPQRAVMEIQGKYMVAVVGDDTRRTSGLSRPASASTISGSFLRASSPARALSSRGSRRSARGCGDAEGHAETPAKPEVKPEGKPAVQLKRSPQQNRRRSPRLLQNLLSLQRPRRGRTPWQNSSSTGPIVAMVISILMTIVGLVAMSGLPTAQFPNIVPPECR